MKIGYNPDPSPIKNLFSAVANALPGFGLFYKGHYLEGLAVVLVELLIALWLIAVIALSYALETLLSLVGIPWEGYSPILNPLTICLGFLPALLFWVWAIFEASREPDLRHQKHR